jgi:predicted ribosomally synthesized peptide with SipW-like signal peptide
MKRLLVAVLALAALAALGVSGTFSRFTDAEQNTDNTFAAAAVFPASLQSVPDVRQTATRAKVPYADPPLYSKATTLQGIQWQLCDDPAGTVCANLAGATTAAYQMRNDASTKAEYFRVVYTVAADGQTFVSRSRLTQAFTIRGPAVAGTTETAVRGNHPTITGTPRVGLPLAATTLATSWSGSGAGVTTFAYQWLRCDLTGATCTPISGATGATYTPVAADVGRRLRTSITATLSGEANTVETPDTAAAVAPA